VSFVGRLRSKSRAAVRLAGRWWTDGRVPGQSTDLIVSSLVMSCRDAVEPVVAALLPPKGGWSRHPAHRHGARRWVVGPALTGSVHDLQHELAGAVVGCLEGAGLSPFVVEADGRRLTFGLEVESRRAALSALRQLPDAGTWYVRWQRGRRGGTQRLRGIRVRRAVARAERWQVVRLAPGSHDRVVGHDHGPVITFWALGPLDRRELVGVRGLERFPDGEPATTEELDGRPYRGTASLPVAGSVRRVDFPIDVVYTWVDGADPRWRAERDRWSGRQSAAASDATLEGRFTSRDELLFSLRALHRNAGWVRNVIVVTAGQRPAWLVEDDRLRVVDHSEIFPAEWLPTFNSHSIESRLHHIPGLAEHFLYLNDDFFLGEPVTPADFFTPNGLPVFFEGEAKVPPAGVAADALLGVDAGAVNGQALIRARFGRVIDKKLLHAPYALRRSVLAEAEAEFPEVFASTGASRFRATTDVSIASAFAHHYGWCTGRAVPGAISTKYVNLENVILARHLQQLRRRRPLTFCLNETEAVPHGDALERRLDGFLSGYFPWTSPWERGVGG